MATPSSSARGRLALAAEIREAGGKGAARKLRRGGRIPATLYGAGQAPLSLALNPKSVAQVLHSDTGHNTVFDLQVAGGESGAAMIVDWQLEPVRGALLHVDLKRIGKDDRLRLRIPVITQGDAIGVKTQGGILELVTREIEIECLPTNIPEHIVVDIANLSIGQNFRAGDLKLDDSKLRVLTDPERVIAHVVAVKEVVEAPAAAEAAAAPAEPEVIRKGKAEEAEAEAGEAKPEAKAEAGKKAETGKKAEAGKKEKK